MGDEIAQGASMKIKVDITCHEEGYVDPRVHLEFHIQTPFALPRNLTPNLVPAEVFAAVLWALFQDTRGLVMQNHTHRRWFVTWIEVLKVLVDDFNDKVDTRATLE